MHSSAIRSDIAIATLCLAVIAILGAVVAVGAISQGRSSADFGVASTADAPDLTEYRQARGTRPLAEIDVAPPRPVIDPTPRRGERSPAPSALFVEPRTIVDAAPTRSRH